MPPTSDDLLREIENLRRRVMELEDLGLRFQRTECELRQNESKFRTCFDQTSLPMAVIGLDGTFEQVNQALCRMLGYAEKELLRLTLQSITHPEDVEDGYALSRNMPEGHGGSSSVEKRYLHKDGTVVWGIQTTCLAPDSADRPSFRVVHVQDITALKNAEKAREESESIVRSIVDHAPCGILLTEPDGTIFKANQTACRMVGMTEQEMCEAGPSGVFDPSDSRLVPALKQRSRTGFFTRELNLRRKDGTVFSAEVSSSLFASRSGEGRASVVVRDLTAPKHIEEALRDSELWMRSVFDALQESVVTATPDRVMKDVNPSTESMFGYCKEEIIGNSTELFHVDHEHYVTFGERISEAFSRGDPAEFEFELRRKNGETFPSHHTVSLLRDKQGEALGIASVVRDITESRRAADALQRKKKLLEEAERLAGVGAWEWDMAQDRFYLSEEWLRIHGTKDPQLSRQALLPLAHPDDRDAILRAFSDAVDKGIPYDMIHRIIRPNDGGERIIRAYGTVERDDSGRPIRMYGAAHDVTEQENAEEAIRQSEVLFRQLSESIEAAFWISSPYGSEVLYVSPGYEGIWGRSCQSLYENPKSWFDAICEEDRARVLSAIENKRASDWTGGQHTEFRVKRPDESIRWVSARSYPIRDREGNVVRIAGLAEDVTERKKAQNQLLESEERLREAQAMAHVGSFSYDCDTDTMLWSDEMYRLFAVEPIGKPLGWQDVRHMIHPEDLEHWRHAFERSIGAGDRATAEHRIVRQDGVVRYHHLAWRVQVSPDGLPSRIVGTVQDVTERKTAQERLERETAANAALAEISVPLLSPSSTVAQIAAIILEKARFLTGSMHGYISEIDTLTGDNVGHTLTNMLEGECEVGEDRRITIPRDATGHFRHLHGHCLNTREAFFTNSPSVHPSSGGVPKGHVPLSRFLSVPVMAEERLLGQIALANSERDYTDDDVEVIGRLAHYYALALERKRWEDALRKSEQSLELTLTAADLHMWDMNLISGEIHFHKGASSTMGGPTGTVKVSEDTWRDSIHREDKVSVLSQLQDVISGASPLCEAEYRVKTASGKWRWAYARGAVVERDQNGAALRIAGTLADVTERKKLEEEARLSHESFTAMVENSGDGILVVNDQGYILYANASVERLFNRGRDKIVGSLFGVPSIRELSEVSIVDTGGAPVTVEMRASRTSWQGQDAWMTLLRDITSRKQYEEALKGSEERLRLLIESSPIGIKIAQEGRYYYVNPAFLQMFAYDEAEDVIGRAIEDLYHEEDRSVVQEQERLCREDKGDAPFYFERRALKRNGETLYVHAWLRNIQFDGRPSVLGFIVDVSKEKNLLEQLVQAQKMEAIGTLSGGIAHDFNNLLTVVSGFTELLLADKQEADSEYQDLEKIATAARRGAELVQGLLAFSRKADSAPHPINLNREVDQVVQLMSRTIPKMISIETSLQKDIQTVNADPGQVEQVLINLIVNAKDAMPDGGKVTISTKKVSLTEGSPFSSIHPDVRPGEYVRVSVSDTGQGMESTIAARIFEPFFTTKRPGRGTGLGLAMAYGIMKQHGGIITCHSEPGEGTTFNLYWPVLRTALEKIASPRLELLPAGNETILIVDDDEPIRDLAERILTRAGYRVLTADNGKVGLDVFTKARDTIDLVLLDLIMPQMGGKDCLARMLEIDPQVKVVLATGYHSGEAGTDPKKLGALALINKPYEATELVRTIRQFLD